MDISEDRPRIRRLVFGLIVSGTVLGLAGTDLVLPAIPELPLVLGGSHSLGQLVLAAFVAGAALGLLLFGSLAARHDPRHLLVASLLAYSAFSVAAAQVQTMAELVLLRFLQGGAGSAAAVFAPGMLRAAYGDAKAVRALGLLGSIESITPALAPVAGLWLLEHYGWNASFHVISFLAATLAAAVLSACRVLPKLRPPSAGAGYRSLLSNVTFLRYTVSHACTLGGLLVFVFSTPTVFVTGFGASFEDFVILQLCGIATFIILANLSGVLSERYGPERLIVLGNLVFAAGCLMMLLYVLAGGRETEMITALFIPMNAGLGLRAPPGFHLAVIAARGDDARGAALVVVGILGATALGTACVAPWINAGMTPVAIAATSFSIIALLVLKLLPALNLDAAPSILLDPRASEAAGC